VGVIISVVNNKGGVGKTIVTCNLADALGRKGKRVLVVDMDSQCNSTSLLIPKGTIRNSIYELLDPDEAEEPLSNYIYPTQYGNVACIPNVPETASLEPKLILKAPDSFLHLRKRIREYTEQRYDFTIIDNPPNMGTFVICSMYASDFVIVPIKAGSAFSVEGLLKAVQVINDIRNGGNPDLKFLRLLINSIDKRTIISRTIVDQIWTAFRDNQIFKTTIPVNTAFERAESDSQTIFQYEPTSTGARAFRDLAKELLDIFANLQNNRSTARRRSDEEKAKYAF